MQTRAIFASAEGRMLMAGLVLAGLLVVGFGIGWTLFPDSILQYAAMTGLNLLIGPGAGMSFGYASGMRHLQVVPLNMLVETLHVLVVYPLFVLIWRHLLDLPALKSFVARMHEAAASRGGMVRKFGIAGLIVLAGLWFLRHATVSIAVPMVAVPEPGTFSIFLPTPLETGLATHVNAPFFGDMSRTHIDFGDAESAAESPAPAKTVVGSQVRITQLRHVPERLVVRKEAAFEATVDAERRNQRHIPGDAFAWRRHDHALEQAREHLHERVRPLGVVLVEQHRRARLALVTVEQFEGERACVRHEALLAPDLRQRRGPAQRAARRQQHRVGAARPHVLDGRTHAEFHAHAVQLRHHLLVVVHAAQGFAAREARVQPGLAANVGRGAEQGHLVAAGSRHPSGLETRDAATHDDHAPARAGP